MAPCGEAQGAHRLDHQPGEVSATAVPELQRLSRRLDALGFPAAVDEPLPDALRQASEKLEGPDRRSLVEELPRPAANLVAGVGMAATPAVVEGWVTVAAVVDRIGPDALGEGQVGRVRRRVFDPDDAFEAQLRGATGELGDRHVVAERIAVEPEAAGLRRDPEGRGDHLLIVGVARPQHHAVLAERDGMAIAVGRDVPDGQRWHDWVHTKHVSRHVGTWLG